MKKILPILLIFFAGSVLAGDYGHGNADSVKWATAYDIANMVDKTGTPAAGDFPKFHDSNTLAASALKDSLGALKFTESEIGDAPLTYATTMATGLCLRNLTPAAVGAQQSSPPLFFRGAGWKTAATAGSQTGIWRMQMRPVQGSSSMEGWLLFDYSLGGADFVNKISIGTNGGISTTGGAYFAEVVKVVRSGTVSVQGIWTYTSAASASTKQRPSPRIEMQSAAWDSVESATKPESFYWETWGRGGGAISGVPSLNTMRHSLWASHNSAAHAEVWNVYGDGTPSGKTGYANGEAAFSTGASADTVTITGALATDIYGFEWTSAPGTPGAVWFERKAGSFIVHTTAAVTGNPTWMWRRRKALP